MEYLSVLVLLSIVTISTLYPIINESGDDTLWRTQGQEFFNLSNYHEALSAFNRAIRINATDDLAWVGQGSTFFKLGYYDEAIGAFEKAIELNPNNTDAQNGRFNVLSTVIAKDMISN